MVSPRKPVEMVAVECDGYAAFIKKGYIFRTAEGDEVQAARIEYSIPEAGMLTVVTNDDRRFSYRANETVYIISRPTRSK